MQIGNIVKTAAKDNMSAIALTDTGNMMAAFHFVSAILNHNKAAEEKNKELEAAGENPTETILKPIVGDYVNVQIVLLLIEKGFELNLRFLQLLF